MDKRSKVVLGIYKSRSQVEMAVDELKTDGFYASDISVLMPDRSGSQDFAHTKGTKALEGAAAGVSTGAIIGGAFGLLVGAVGGVTGALVSFGIPEYEAKRYEGFVKDGGILLSVHADSAEEVTKAMKCLERTYAEDISSTNETKGESKPYFGTDKLNRDSRIETL